MRSHHGTYYSNEMYETKEDGLHYTCSYRFPGERWFI